MLVTQNQKLVYRTLKEKCTALKGARKRLLQQTRRRKAVLPRIPRQHESKIKTNLFSAQEKESNKKQ